MRVLAVLLAITWCSTQPALAQGTANSALSGVAVDPAGGAIPGATVVVKNNATGVSLEAVTNASGQFSFPQLAAGHVHRHGVAERVQDVRRQHVRLLAARPGDITAKLEIGALTETVASRPTTELIQTQTTAVASTLSVEQLTELPLVSRNALYAVALLPGVVHDRRSARRDHQRPAEQHRQHHDRRHRHGQHAAVDRRLLLDGHAAHGRGGRNHDDGRGARRRRRRRLGAGRAS